MPVPLLEHHNTLYTKWLKLGQIQDQLSFKQVRGEARQAIRRAKNKWFQAEAERETFGGKKLWQCIRSMQSGRRGLLPSLSVSINDEVWKPCATLFDTQQRRWRHFSMVLNVQSKFDDTELDLVRQRYMVPDIEQQPSVSELSKALGQLKSGKAGGSSNILPEIVKVVGSDREFLELLLDLIYTVWEERQVPQEWVDAIIISIPKKGNLSDCNNWRGIALLEVSGKVVAELLQQRLQLIAERELPESQCGFRKGRGCVDMIFTICQLAEKALEHRTKQFFPFVP